MQPSSAFELVRTTSGSACSITKHTLGKNAVVYQGILTHPGQVVMRAFLAILEDKYLASHRVEVCSPNSSTDDSLNNVHNAYVQRTIDLT